MSFSHRQQIEAFHFLFLERLLKMANPHQFALKGGVNLRFFFASPRYSEDLDLDVLAGSVATLKKNGYRILQDPAFARALATYGIAELFIGDPGKAKQTATTQRFRARLVTASGEFHPTKVEFSRRRVQETSVLETIDPSIAQRYRRLSFACRHYPAGAAWLQKARALANRTQIQVRDAFDLHVLWLGGHVGTEPAAALTEEERERAAHNLLTFSYADYEGQVLEYLAPEHQDRFASESCWNELRERLFGLLAGQA